MYTSGPAMTCDLDSSTDSTAACPAGCTLVEEFVTSFKVKKSTDGTTWSYITLAGFAQEFVGNMDGSSVASVLFDSPVTARYLQIEPVLSVGAATVSVAANSCSDRTEGVCAYDVLTYSGSMMTLDDVFADTAANVWTSFPGAAQTTVSTAVVGSTQTAQQAQFVKVTTDQTGCTYSATIAEVELFAQAYNCDDSNALVWPVVP